MEAARDPLALLCDKLQANHPQLQRIAVSSIFDKFRSSKSSLESSSGENALRKCIESPHSSVVDQTIREICSLAKSGVVSYGKAIHILQMSLDSVATASMVQVVVSGIGFICRMSISSNSDTFTINPLLKALQSREEAHMEVLQQVRLVLLQFAKTQQQRRSIEFIKPLLARVCLDPSQADFARQLHSSLCVLATNDTDLGFRLFKVLLRYIQHRTLISSKDLNFLSTALDELVDVLNVIADTPGKFTEAKEYVKGTLGILFKFYSDTIKRQLSSVRILNLIKRTSSIAVDVLEAHDLDVYLFMLAHFLAVSEVEFEQLLVISLASSWLKDEGSAISGFRVLSMLYWIFPLLHILSCPSGPLREAACNLMQQVEDVLSKHQIFPTRTSNFANLQPGGDFVLLCKLWLEEQADTWANLIYPAPKLETNRTVAWLTNVHTYLMDNPLETDFPLRLTMLTTVLMFHPTGKVAIAATKVLSALGKNKPIWGMSLFPVLVFSLKFRLQMDCSNHQDVTVALLHALPDICSHPTTLPLSMHFLQPMMGFKSNLVIPATTIRLLYKIWESSDRTFPHIQKHLHPSSFSEKPLETEVVLSKAIALRDICKHDADRGIELIFSVQACIESGSSLVQSLGLQALSFLCDDDAIDFYTAWNVVSKFCTPLPKNPTLAESWSILFKHGAREAAANPDEARSILSHLQVLASFNEPRVRSAALESMAFYEVELLKETMVKHVDILLSETNPTAKRLAEAVIIKYLKYEHETRQRSSVTTIPVTKFGKLLEGIPRTFLGRNEERFIIESAGSALLLWHPPTTTTARTGKSSQQKARKSESEIFRNFFMDAVKNLSFTNDPISMMTALQSWSWFVSNWLSADARVHGDHRKSLESLRKICMDIIEESIPRVAENATLAVASLTKSSSQAGLGISATITEYLQSRLALHGIGCADWSTALSLGVASSSLHTTDWSLQSKSVQCLVECASSSNSGITVAAAALGLGHISQALLLSSRVHGLDTDRELRLLSTIVFSLLRLLHQVCPASGSTVESLAASEFFRGARNGQQQGSRRHFDSDGETFWAIAGLVSGLGSSVVAIARAGETNLVKDISDGIVGWLPESLDQDGLDVLSLAAGSSLAISGCLKACYRLELLDGTTVKSVLRRFQLLLGHTFDSRMKQSCCVHAFRAGCLGAGDFVANILQTGAYPLDIHSVNSLLKIFQEGYNDAQTALGAMFGLANALGSGTGILSDQRIKAIVRGYEQAGDSQFITGPLMFNTASEELLTSMVQKMVGLSHTNQDTRVRSCARWSLGFMHTTWLSKAEPQTSTTSGNHWVYRPVNLSSLPEHNTLRILCEWLTSIGVTKTAVPCAATISVLECLQKAPRLPALDWGGLVRRLMQHSEWFNEGIWNHSEIRKGIVLFCLGHAANVPPLAGFLDEIYERSRFSVLEISLQDLLLEQLSRLESCFSISRMETLLEDLGELLDTLTKDRQRDFRIHCWKGLTGFFTGSSKLQVPVEMFMKRLVFSLDCKQSRDDEEWTTATDCMAHARKEWLLETFRVDKANMEKAAFARSRLVARDILPVSALQPFRLWLFNQGETGDYWTLFLEIARGLRRAEFEEKKQWLLDALDAPSVSNNPTTAVEFLALMSSLWDPCAYLRLIERPSQVLEVLPESLPSLLLDSKWTISAAKIAARIFDLTEKLSSSTLFELLDKVSISTSQHVALEAHIVVTNL